MSVSSPNQQLEAARQRLEQFQTGSSELQPEAVKWWTTQNAMTISVVVLVFGIITLALATYLINSGKSSEAILRTYGTILIIVTSVFLVVAGYSSNQIAPVMGLMGTVAGYLLGKGEASAKKDE